MTGQTIYVYYTKIFDFLILRDTVSGESYVVSLLS